MTLYDDMMEGAIDVHCHIDFEFSAKERKREPEFLWLPKAEALGMRGVVRLRAGRGAVERVDEPGEKQGHG